MTPNGKGASAWEMAAKQNYQKTRSEEVQHFVKNVIKKLTTRQKRNLQLILEVTTNPRFSKLQELGTDKKPGKSKRFALFLLKTCPRVYKCYPPP